MGPLTERTPEVTVDLRKELADVELGQNAMAVSNGILQQFREHHHGRLRERLRDPVVRAKIRPALVETPWSPSSAPSSEPTPPHKEVGLPLQVATPPCATSAVPGSALSPPLLRQCAALALRQAVLMPN